MDARHDHPHEHPPARRRGGSSALATLASLPAAVGGAIAALVFAVAIVVSLPLLVVRSVFRARRAAQARPALGGDVLAAPLQGEAA